MLIPCCGFRVGFEVAFGVDVILGFGFGDWFLAELL